MLSRYACILILGVSTLATAQTADDLKTGDRFKPLAYSELNAAQKAMLAPYRERIAKAESRAQGKKVTFSVEPQYMANREMSTIYPGIRSPELTQMMLNAIHYLRAGAVPRRLQELADLMVARSWTAQYEFQSHHQHALKAGLSEDIIEAIAAGERPRSMKPDEAAVYDFCAELLSARQVSDNTYQALKKQLGSERAIVELMGTIAVYDYVSMLTVVDRFPLPDKDCVTGCEFVGKRVLQTLEHQPFPLPGHSSGR
jgi:alkylhydroperoxidase family enzyme